MKLTFLCLHGSSSSAKIFNPLKKIYNLDADILDFDLPGHGSKKDTINFKFQDLCKFVKDAAMGIEGNICLVGNSLGGHISIEIAKDLKNLVGLLIFGTPPFKKPINTHEAFLPEPDLGILFDESPKEADIQRIYDKAVINKSVKDLIIQDFLNTNPEFRSTLAKDIRIPGTFQDECLIFNSLQCRKYIIHGESDPTVNLSYIKKELRNYELFEIENCGHFPSAERPEMFLDILTKMYTDLIN